MESERRRSKFAGRVKEFGGDDDDDDDDDGVAICEIYQCRNKRINPSAIFRPTTESSKTLI